jgi:hypothetical protein
MRCVAACYYQGDHGDSESPGQVTQVRFITRPKSTSRTMRHKRKAFESYRSNGAQ